MIISEGKGRTALNWQNKEMSWEEFREKCSKPVRTYETKEEYKNMSSSEKAEVKNGPGFVGGELKDGRRKGECVVSRCLVTLDLDNAPKNFESRIEKAVDCKYLAYSTHSHTPETPRIRLVIPLSRPVTAEEYQPISRMIASDIGIEMVDPTCFMPPQLMYYPSTSKDGDFYFKSKDGPLTDPDKILGRYKDWHDTTTWPICSKEETVVKRSIKRQENPLFKRGVIGAFCRAYTIRMAIDKFLPDVYKPSAVEGRYDYVPGESTAGVVLYDDKFAYSHHSTDPAGGKLLNAFDLVRIHLFGQLDEDADPDTPTAKRPSYKAMRDFAVDDEETRLQLARDREAAVFNDVTTAADDKWMTKLELDQDGNVKNSLTNYVLIMRNDPKLQEIMYNQHSMGIVVRNPGKLPWNVMNTGWSDADAASLAAYIDSQYHIFSQAKLKAAVLVVASERAFHPVKEYFDSLPAWDRIKRAETLLIDYLGAEDTPYNRAVIRKTLVAAAARIYEPGLKFDTILVLIGDQGIGKSTLFSRLGGKWFSDSLSISDMRDKTAPEKLQGFWILEISEMNGIKKMDVETVKSFVSRQDDKYRPAYGTVVESHPRQCIIVGTTNTKTGFLRDVTGNRRFWPVTLSGSSKYHPWDLTQDEVDQIWAEALHLYKNGEELILTGEEAAMAIEKQKEALEGDDREGLVREYLDKLLPEDWAEMDLSERRVFLQGNEFEQAGIKGTVRRDRVCNVEIWAECLCKDPTSIQKQDSYAIAAIMSRIEGWERYTGNKTGKLSFPKYGSQCAYVRTAIDD